MATPYSASLPLSGPSGHSHYGSHGTFNSIQDGLSHDNTLSLVATTSNDKSWPPGSGNPISSSNNPWSHLYGIAKKQIGVDPEKSFNEEIRDLPDAYADQQSELLGKILISQMTATRSFWINEICPYKKTDQITTTMKTWLFKDEFLGQVPEQGVPHLIRNNMSSRSASVTKKGIGFYNEHMFLTTPMGEQGFWMQMEQVNQATTDTACHEIATKLYNGDEESQYRAKRNAGMTYSQYQALIDRNINMWGALQKYDEGFQYVVAKARETMKARVQQEGNLLIVPAGAEQYTWEGQLIDNGVLMRSGVRTDMRWWKTVSGMVQRESRKFVGYEEDGADPAYNRRLIGGFTTITMNQAKNAPIKNWSWRVFGAREIWSEFHDTTKTLSADLATYSKTGFAPGISTVAPNWEVSNLDTYDDQVDYPFQGSSDSRRVTFGDGAKRTNWGLDYYFSKPVPPRNLSQRIHEENGDEDGEGGRMSAFSELLKHNPQQKYAPWARQWFADMGWKSHGHSYEKQGLLDLLARCITMNLEDEDYKDLLYNHLFPGRQPPPSAQSISDNKMDDDHSDDSDSDDDDDNNNNNNNNSFKFVSSNAKAHVRPVQGTTLDAAIAQLEAVTQSTTLAPAIGRALTLYSEDYKQVGQARANALLTAINFDVKKTVKDVSLITNLTEVLKRASSVKTEDAARKFIINLTWVLFKMDAFSYRYSRTETALPLTGNWDDSKLLYIDANAELAGGKATNSRIGIPLEAVKRITDNYGIMIFSISDQDIKDFANGVGPLAEASKDESNGVLRGCVYVSLWYHYITQADGFADIKTIFENVNNFDMRSGVSTAAGLVEKGQGRIVFAQSLSSLFITEIFNIARQHMFTPGLFDDDTKEDEDVKKVVVKLNTETVVFKQILAAKSNPSSIPRQVAQVATKRKLTVEEKDQIKITEMLKTIAKQYQNAPHGSFTKNYLRQLYAVYITCASSTEPNTQTFWSTYGLDNTNILTVMTIILKSFEDVNNMDKNGPDHQPTMYRFMERLLIHIDNGIPLSPNNKLDVQVHKLIDEAKQELAKPRSTPATTTPPSISSQQVIALIKAYDDELQKQRDSARKAFKKANMMLTQTMDAHLDNDQIKSNDPLSQVVINKDTGKLTRLSHSLLKQVLVENTPFTSYRFFKFIVEHDLPVCFGILSFRPNQEWEMGSMCLTMGGGEIGRHLVMLPDFQMQNDSMRKVMIANFTIYMGTMILEPRKIVIIPDVYCRAYHGGWGITEWDASNPIHIEKQARTRGRAFDMYHCIIPAIYNAPKWQHLNGRMPKEIRDQQEGAPEYTYPTAPYYTDHVWYNWKEEHTNLTTNAFAGQENTLCFQDFQTEVNPIQPNTLIITNNKGPWGMTIYEGSAQARAGGHRKLRQFTLTNHHSLITITAA